MTWFKKAIGYRITDIPDLSPATLQAAIASKLARQPANDELSTYGFATPLPQVDGVKSNVLAHPCGSGILICAEKWIRKPPAKAVDKELDAQVLKIEQEHGRKVKGNERREMKAAIITAMLPNLLPECRHTTALILPSDGLIIVDTVNPAVAEDLLSTLREVLGSLPVRPLRTTTSPTLAMTTWLKEGQAPEGFTLLDSAVLVGEAENKGTKPKANLSKMDLTSDEVQLHISTGKKAAKLALAWTDKVFLKLTDKITIESIKLTDVMMSDVLQANGEGEALQHFDGSMTIMAGTLRDLFKGVLVALGGEEMPEAASAGCRAV